MLPAAAPAGPAPAEEVVAEVVATVAAPVPVLKVVGADAPHPRVVAIALQQGGTVGEKVGMGNTIVLQDDAFLQLLKNQNMARLTPQAAALVHVRIEALDLA